MADKPVLVSNDINLETDSNNRVFRKSSIQYLWPELTMGLGLDNIRVAMENIGIDRLGHESSDKTGAVNVGSIYTAGGNVKSLEEVTSELKNSARVIGRRGLPRNRGDDTRRATDRHCRKTSDVFRC